MFQSFFTGLSGMFSFSKNLDNVSNNIANMNTPGFKGSDTFYTSLTNGDSSAGTQISGQGQRFTAGDIRQTGNAGDLAIGGEGFFVLLNDSEVQYSRAGQFLFNDEGMLVDSVSGGQVASINDSGQLESISIDDMRVLAPQATSGLSFSGNLSTDMTTHTVSGLQVFNSLGEQRTVSFEFTNNSSTLAGSWLVTVTDENGKTVGNSEIRFDTDGTPVDDFSSVSFDITDANGGTATIVAEFGANGSFADSTSVSGGATSTLHASVDDGFAMSSLTTVDFTSDGKVILNYANGETVDGPTLALANFNNTSTLEVVEGSLFRAKDNSSRTLATAGESGLGTVISESIELSNVDLSREFADMIIIQRGYQASSRVLNVANQLLDQLYENTRGR